MQSWDAETENSLMLLVIVQSKSPIAYEISRADDNEDSESYIYHKPLQ